MMLQGASWRGACYRVHVGGACSEGHVTGGMLFKVSRVSCCFKSTRLSVATSSVLIPHTILRPGR